MAPYIKPAPKLRKPEDPLLVQYPANYNIKASELRVVDSQGNNIGVLTFKDAMYKAKQEELDLVAINIDANPVVARILDYKKFIYDQRIAKKNQAKKNRENLVVIKEIQLRPVTDSHDLSVKINHAKGFLSDNNKVKVVIKFKGRELSFSQKGFEVIKKFIDELGPCKIEKAPEMNGRSIIAILAPAPAVKK